ncbi:RagB/SusD family nutrient uptake outer membrane protein [Lutibacter citreus]|uniref:RagB/SusD family nutrient uptake outer membrane protein n=1 Tax=Lutibacter citreus TaxID=2138210 RepID=UPI000DBE41AF|nr:RagB/SusD family nutrient uptake outer membrane protein [Lutibacter citreus]
MKSHKIFKINSKYCILILLVSFLSCEDYLEVETYGFPVVEGFYKTAEDGEQALTAAYAPMREAYTKYIEIWSTDMFIGDTGTDDILKGGLGLFDQEPLVQKESYNLTSSNKYWDKRWLLNYKGILYANLVLEKIPSITFENEDRKKEILGEAHFLRGYYYLYLVNMFGGVPLYDKPVNPSDANIPRATKEETYAFIENDLKEAINILPSRFEKNSILGHADKGAALGLMMRVMLYQNKMEEVKTYGEELFKLPYTLPKLENVFQPEGEWGTGSIFEINYSTNTSKLGTSAPRMMMPRTSKIDNGFGFSQIKMDVIDAYEANDPRLNAYFYTAIKGPDDNLYETGFYNRKYVWYPYSNYNKPTVGGLMNSDINIRIVRLADAYLMYAESIYLTNPASAIEYVNKVRQRARGMEADTVVPDLSLSLSGDALRDAIYLERRLEMIGEGLRYQDLIRTGRAAEVLGPLGFKSGVHEVMPLPKTQVDISNGVLEQNSGY